MKTISSHVRSFDLAPKVAVGDRVVFIEYDLKNAGWFFGRDGEGTEGFFPAPWFRIDEERALAVAERPYDAMELSVEAGSEVVIAARVGPWCWVDSGTKRGWIPTACLGA